jgi:hypothetical protein
VNGEDMRGRGIREKGTFGNLGKRKHYWRLETVFPGWIFSGFGVWVDCYRGAPGCWEFWARGPGILMESWS